MIVATDLSVSLGGRCVLSDVFLKLDQGEVLALCGPNGAGKSTLLACLAGEHPSCHQSVDYFGAKLAELTPLELSRLRVVLEQSPTLSAEFSLSELAELGAPLALPPAELDRIKANVLAEFGFQSMADTMVSTLSGGQQHRAHLARVLVHLGANQALGASGFLFLDEPTSSLDIAHQIKVLRMTRKLAEDSVGVLVVLHDLNLAAAFADRVVLLREGRVVGSGRPKRVFTQETLSEVYNTPILVDSVKTGQIVVQPML